LVPYASAPRYFDTYGRKEPKTPNHIVSSFAYGHPEWTLYELILADPGRKARFPPAMAAVEERMPVGGIYDFSWLVDELRKNQTPDRIAFIDIGGNKGNAIKTITDEFPGIPRHRCILQDRPETIEAVKATDEPELREVQKMVIDFNVEQPIKGTTKMWPQPLLFAIRDLSRLTTYCTLNRRLRLLHPSMPPQLQR